MATNKDLRNIAKKRLRTVKILMSAKDWESAAYLMGLVLECSMKAVTCKTLRLEAYPEYTRKKEIDSYFMTHRFDLLLLVSGLSEIFSLTGEAAIFNNWSNFTIEYPGDWPAMRYNNSKIWNETKVKQLYKNLTEANHGILSIISKRKKW